MSTGSPWLIGYGRFLVISVTKSTQRMNGTVFETDDGTRFVIAPAQMHEEAGAAAAGGELRMFGVRPTWSYPAEDWIAADPEFWRRSLPKHK